MHVLRRLIRCTSSAHGAAVVAICALPALLASSRSWGVVRLDDVFKGPQSRLSATLTGPASGRLYEAAPDADGQASVHLVDVGLTVAISLGLAGNASTVGAQLRRGAADPLAVAVDQGTVAAASRHHG